VRFGIIGGGNISATHAKAAVAAGAEVAAFYGRDAEKTLRLAREHGGTAYEDLERFLLHDGLDAVIVGSPSGLHGDHACAAARLGLHALVEKPLEISTTHADELIADCDRAGVKLGVIFQDRTAPDLAWLKRLIDDGGLGTPILASARLRWYRPPEYYSASSWRGTRAMDGGGAVINQGVHSLDLLLWLLGDVNRVYATTRTALHDIDVEDTAVACFEFAGGGIGTFEAATSAYPGSPRRVEMSGSNGTVLVEQDRVVSVDLRTPPPPLPVREEVNANPSSTSAVVSDIRGHQRVIADFIAAIADDRSPLCDGRDGRRSVALVEAIYRSAQTGAATVPQGAAP
jgi:UDP-N-acetyl-2-amino-2-deoxyglucuronate dehydrogenase